ncbi:hypothetical protein HMPREF1624_06984 [Sporothrix schenckii ATCC 58251]|uniref:Uncharacterized protein n=1 Tax=Sporothrix schenckii (strain ATCC 58251 / de Perez 2211183) TaxID=1391915 RepID=U7PQK0_SPOS1|nr:hypothetical protein HMPREF1624_06984 [Sporothrix schenckii ATCC 58251]
MSADGYLVKHVIVTTTLKGLTTTLSSTTFTSTVTCFDDTSCNMLAISLASDFRVDSVGLATQTNTRTVTGTTILTSYGKVSRTRHSSASPAPYAFAAGASAVPQLPLGSTVVNGTFNTCLLPPGAIATIIHCWGPGAKPLQYTCSEQPIDGAPQEVTDIAEVITACTVITTMKGPTLVRATSTLPNYDFPGPTQDTHFPPNPNKSNFVSAPSGPQAPGGNRDTGIGAPVETGVPGQTWVGTTTVPIAILPTGVVIGSSTITDDPNNSQYTTVVTIGGIPYTITPDQIAAMGSAVQRPSWSNNYISGHGPDQYVWENFGDNIVYAAAPASSVLGTMSVQVSGNSIVVDGTSFSIPAQPSVGVVHGETVHLGPDGVVAGGQTLSVSPVVMSAGAGGGGHSEVVVAGGTVLTLDDTNVVVEGYTIAYNAVAGGLGTSSVLTVAGDTVTIVPGPSNGAGSHGGRGGAFIVIHGTTFTAPAAGSTHYELVGGATFTEVSPSVIVLDGHSYTIGPATVGASGGLAAAVAASGATPTTVVIRGETLTIGPGGVTVGGTVTFRFPFVATPTVTLTGTATITNDAAMKPGPVGGLQSGATPTPTSAAGGNSAGFASADSNNGGPGAGSKNASSRTMVSVAAVGLSLVVSFAAALSSLIYLF